MKPTSYTFEEGDAVIVYNELIDEWCAAIIKTINPDDSIDLDTYSVQKGVTKYTVLRSELLGYHYKLNVSKELKEYINEVREKDYEDFEKYMMNVREEETKEVKCYRVGAQIVYFDTYNTPHIAHVRSFDINTQQYEIKTFSDDIYTVSVNDIIGWEEQMKNMAKYHIGDVVSYDDHEGCHTQGTIKEIGIVEDETSAPEIEYTIHDIQTGCPIWISESKLDMYN